RHDAPRRKVPVKLRITPCMNDWFRYTAAEAWVGRCFERNVSIRQLRARNRSFDPDYALLRSRRPESGLTESIGREIVSTCCRKRTLKPATVSPRLALSSVIFRLRGPDLLPITLHPIDHPLRWHEKALAEGGQLIFDARRHFGKQLANNKA